jgi:hypothetical protein
MSWRIEGDYFESCNCEAICPCRMVGGVAGGRSTYGICLGALSWRVETGEKDGVDLSGLAAALVCRYDDDEPGSPWRFVLHVDARGDDDQRAALEEILLGRAGGEQVLRLPWVRKPSELLAVRASEIELGGGELRVAEAVRLRATRPVESDETVRCGIPGYDEPGQELYADEFTVDDGELRWELAGNCAFRSRFAYEG